jgi:aspartyl-tRNA(Asn)/glutamyl-tRNA(Gln) amidotransferase subunit A
MLGGKNVSAADFLNAVTAVRQAQAAFAAWMRGRDALLTPTLPITAVPVADVDESTAPLAALTRPVNYLGGCALTLPAGISSTGLPIGVQLIGAAFTEPTLIRLGRAFQDVTDWHRRRPPA